MSKFGLAIPKCIADQSKGMAWHKLLSWCRKKEKHTQRKRNALQKELKGTRGVECIILTEQHGSLHNTPADEFLSCHQEKHYTTGLMLSQGEKSASADTDRLGEDMRQGTGSKCPSSGTGSRDTSPRPTLLLSPQSHNERHRRRLFSLEARGMKPQTDTQRLSLGGSCDAQQIKVELVSTSFSSEAATSHMFLVYPLLVHFFFFFQTLIFNSINTSTATGPQCSCPRLALLMLMLTLCSSFFIHLAFTPSTNVPCDVFLLLHIA